MAIKLIVGLRNPGGDYENTRHNAGGWFVEALAQHYNISFKVEKKLHCELTSFVLDHDSCRVMLPLTFMNQSGLPTREVRQFYRIQPHEMLVIHDDLDLPAGRLRIKTGGGHGGHNGLRDVITQLNSADFHRLRIGIGHPGHKEQVLNYVLGKPPASERQLILDAISRAIAIMPTILMGNFQAAMNLLNG